MNNIVDYIMPNYTNIKSRINLWKIKIYIGSIGNTLVNFYAINAMQALMIIHPLFENFDFCPDEFGDVLPSRINREIFDCKIINDLDVYLLKFYDHLSCDDIFYIIKFASICSDYNTYNILSERSQINISYTTHCIHDSNTILEMMANKKDKSFFVHGFCKPIGELKDRAFIKKYHLSD